MSLDVQVKIEGANPAVTAADKVADALGRVEDKGPEVGESISKGMAAAQRAVTNLGRSFQGLEAAMNARARATQIHAQLTNTWQASVNGLVAAMGREQAMLESIRGPMNRYEQEIQTLDSMLKRNVITLNEHTAAVSRARSAAGMGSPMNAVSLPGMSQKKTGKEGTGTSLANMAAGAAIGFGTGQLLELGDSYIGLENRLRQVTKSQAELNATMDRVKKIASNTRSDLGTTGEAYVRLVNATKSMGVSQERAFKITETLNMALQSSGKSAAEASSGTLQLMQAMAAGALQGDEFRSISEAMPELLDVFSKQLGVTRGELKKMGAEGKITTEIMVKALEAFGPDARRNFEKTEETFGQFATGVKNSAAAFLGGGISMANAWKNWGSATQALRMQEIELGNTMARKSEMFGTLISDATKMTAATYALTKSQLLHMQQTDMLVRSLTTLSEMMKIIQGIKYQDPWGDARTGWEKFRGSVVDKARGAFGAMKKHVDEYSDATKKATSDTKQWLDQMDEAIKRHKEGRFVGDGTKQGKFVRENFLADSATGGFKIDASMQQQADALAKSHADVFGAVDKERQAREERMRQSLHDQRVKRLEDEQKKFEDARQRMADGFGDLMSDIAKTALEGTATVNDIMRQMWMGMFKMMSQQALGSAFGVSVPGFATGGSFMVGGSGGTDSQPVAFMASPNERVTIETPEQQRERDSSGDGARAINIHLDERDALRALDTPEGERLIVRVIKKFDPARRGHTSGN